MQARSALHGEELGEVRGEGDVVVDVHLGAGVRLPSPLALEGEQVAACRHRRRGASTPA